jgi:septum formation protein
MASASLVLGSGSPRRREILANLGVPFVVHVAGADETIEDGELPQAYLERVVRAKLAAVGEVYTPTSGSPVAPRDVVSTTAVLVADTSVIDGVTILGKPADLDEAEAMIARLAGRTLVVAHEETVITRVTFRALSAAQVRAYAVTGEGLDKAGGYAVQGRGAGIVARVEGSYTNVVGLPACELLVALEALGLAP